MDAIMEDEALLSQRLCLLVKETLGGNHFKPLTHSPFISKRMLCLRETKGYAFSPLEPSFYPLLITGLGCKPGH